MEINAETLRIKFDGKLGKWCVLDLYTKSTYCNRDILNVVMYSLSHYNHLEVKCLRCQSVSGELTIDKTTKLGCREESASLTIERNVIEVKCSSGVTYCYPKTIGGLAMALVFIS